MLYLIVNADDFGISSTVNNAIAETHQNGILQSASLMVTGDAWEEAVAIAKTLPKFEIGLHLVFLQSKAVMPPSKIPLLVNENGLFPDNPVKAGIKWFFNSDSQRQIHLEIEAQIERFISTGLPLTHINSHLHFHMHPAIFNPLVKIVSSKYGNVPIRIPWEPLFPSLRCSKDKLAQKLFYSGIFHTLSTPAKKQLCSHKIPHCDRVIGFLETGRLKEQYILDLIPLLPDAYYELYTHPGAYEAIAGNAAKDESILSSSKVKDLFEKHQVQLIGWKALKNAWTSE